MSQFKHITLLDGLPDTCAEGLEAALQSVQPLVQYARPLIPSHLTVKEALDFVEEFYVSQIPPESLLVGLGRSGLVATAIQNLFPALKFSVVAINSPSEEGEITAKPCPTLYGRLVLYSAGYPAIKGHCNWKAIDMMAYDLPWLKDGCSRAIYPLAYLISTYSRGANMDKEVHMMFPH